MKNEIENRTEDESNSETYCGYARLKLDDKGRFAMPDKFIEIYGKRNPKIDTVVYSTVFDKNGRWSYFSLYDPKAQKDHFNLINYFDRFEMTMDDQKRVLIPVRAREKLKLNREVNLIGDDLDTLELWVPESFQQYQKSVESGTKPIYAEAYTAFFLDQSRNTRVTDPEVQAALDNLARRGL